MNGVLNIQRFLKDNLSFDFGVVIFKVFSVNN